VNEGQQDHRCQKERGAGGVGNGRPEGVENAADRGAGDGRKLGGGSGRRDRARKQRDRHAAGKQGLLGRRLERPSDPEHEHRGQDELPRHPAGDWQPMAKAAAARPSSAWQICSRRRRS